LAFTGAARGLREDADFDRMDLAVGALDPGRGDVVAGLDIGNAATLFLTRVMTATLAASSIVSAWPSRDLTIRLWPSSLSTVPRMRVGVPGLGESGPNR
jgi:hypothetical protein